MKKGLSVKTFLFLKGIMIINSFIINDLAV